MSFISSESVSLGRYVCFDGSTKLSYNRSGRYILNCVSLSTMRTTVISGVEYLDSDAIYPRIMDIFDMGYPAYIEAETDRGVISNVVSIDFYPPVNSYILFGYLSRFRNLKSALFRGKFITLIDGQASRRGSRFLRLISESTYNKYTIFEIHKMFEVVKPRYPPEFRDLYPLIVFDGVEYDHGVIRSAGIFFDLFRTFLYAIYVSLSVSLRSGAKISDIDIGSAVSTAESFFNDLLQEIRSSPEMSRFMENIKLYRKDPCTEALYVHLYRVLDDLQRSIVDHVLSDTELKVQSDTSDISVCSSGTGMKPVIDKL